MKTTSKAIRIVCAVIAVGAAVVMAQQDRYIINKPVSIPFSAAFGIGVARETLPLDPGDYTVNLSVARATWDQGADSAAASVPIGMQWLIQDRATGRDIGKSPWSTGNGKTGLRVKVPQNARCIIFYSTAAPAGAAGRLTVEKL